MDSRGRGAAAVETAAGRPAGERATTDWRVVVTCTAIMIVEGYDLLLFSNAIPALIADEPLGVDRAGAGTIGSMAFLGMLLGGMLAGAVSRRLGTASTVFTGIIGFTLATAAVALAGSGVQIGVLRLVAGAFLGLVLPAALSAARRATADGDGSMTITLVMSGIAIGAVVSTLTAQWVLGIGGWRTLFLAGGIVGLLLLALTAPALRRMPREPHGPAGSGTLRELLVRGRRGMLLLGIATTFVDLLTWYGVSTWLTQLMRDFDLPMDSALQLMLTLNIGAVVGSIGAAMLARRWGSRPVAALAGVLAAGSLLLIAARIGPAWLTTIAAALLGVGAITAQNLANDLVADAFPARLRTTALGMTLGLGRIGAVAAPILGGQILAAGLGPARVLESFAAAALLGSLLALAFTDARRARGRAS